MTYKQASGLAEDLRELNISLYKLVLKMSDAYPGCDAGTCFGDVKTVPPTDMQSVPACHMVRSMDSAYTHIKMAVFQADTMAKLIGEEERKRVK